MPIDFHKFKDAFLGEAKTYVKLMNNALLEFEKNPKKTKSFQEILRAVHTLKSLAGTMNYNNTMSLCHVIEDLLDSVRHKEVKLEDCIDLIFKSFDYLNENIKKLTSSEEELNAEELIQQLQNVINKKVEVKKEIFENMPLSTETLGKIQEIEVKVERLDMLMNLAEELLVCKMKFDSLEKRSNDPELSSTVESLARLITDLQYYVMQIRLIPIEFIFSRFLRMTRDLAKQQKKEVTVQIEGGEIELDRLLIDVLGEAIVHLIRNAIDHGLETPKVREKMHKPCQGTLLLRARRSKEAAVIEVSDDGAGLDVEAIRKLALKNKLIKPNATPTEVIETIFSNLSTKQVVTAVSGRGLGLAIVKEKIESIGGTIRVVSTSGKGTTFIIEIPLSLAIIKTLFVSVSENIYAIPIDAVERLIVVISEDFKGLMQDEAIIFEQDDIPVVRLSTLFGSKPLQLHKQPIVIIQKEGRRLGLVVDSLLSTQDVVVKPLGRSVRDNKYFSGAALIGSGQMVLILDVMNLLPTDEKIHSLAS